MQSGEVKSIDSSTVDYLTKNLRVAKVRGNDYDILKSCEVLRTEKVWKTPRILVGTDYFFEFLKKVEILK